MIDETIESLKERWYQILYDYFKSDIYEAINEGKHSITIDWHTLGSYEIDPDLADYTLEKPYISLYAAEEALKDIPTSSMVSYPLRHVRIKNLPEIAHRDISSIRAASLGKFIAVDGVVSKITEVHPKLEDAVFQCMRCGAIIKVPQDDTIMKEPTVCYEDQGGCGRITKMKLLTEHSKFVDFQKIEIQESPEGLRGQPQKLILYAQDDMAGVVVPGDRITVNGILHGRQRRRGGLKFTEFSKVIDVISFEHKEYAFEEVEVSPDDEKMIKSYAKDPNIYDYFIQSIAPTIYGMDIIKEAIVLQLFGGVPKTMPDGTRIRGDIHILLVGDPGTAKSQLLQYVAKIAPRSIYASGKSSSAAGLTASAVRSDFGEGRWTLEAGALVLADLGLVAVDEIDKMRAEDRDALHPAMEQQELCYDDKTEILTKEGWKYFKDITYDDEIATLTKDGYLEYHKPKSIIKMKYKGKMVKVDGSRKVDLVVTPNHKMYVSIYKRGKYWHEFDLIEAKEIINKRVRYKRDAKWNGCEKKYFVIPSITKKLNQHSKFDTGCIKIPMDDWLEFFGYWISEGSFTGKYYVYISQQGNKVNVDKIKKCLDRLPFKYRYDGSRFVICSKQLVSYLSQFGHAPNKYIPTEIKQLSSRQLKILLDALMLGDGHIGKTNKMYFTTSKRLADDIQEILLKVGMSGNIRNLKTAGRMFEIEGSSRKSNYDEIVISLTNKNQPQVGYTPKLGRNAATHKYVDYDGMVYCVEVPNHVIYVRRNGIPVWSGNSIHKAGINAKLKTRCALLAAANPKYGRFDYFMDVAKQINLPSALLSRFDMIFIVYDRPNRDRDARMAEHILRVHRAGEAMDVNFSTDVIEDIDKITPRLTPEEIRKYVSYARRECKPVLTREAERKIQDFYLKLRMASNESIAITPRQIESLIRMAEASARVRLSSIVTVEDANRAIKMMKHFIKESAIDTENGLLDIDVVATGISHSQRERIKSLMDTIDKLTEEHGYADISLIRTWAREQGLDVRQIEEDLDELNKRGVIMCPRQGKYKVVK